MFLCVHAYMHIYTYMYACMYIYICTIHTYIHTYIRISAFQGNVSKLDAAGLQLIKSETRFRDDRGRDIMKHREPRALGPT